ncbi:MAG TPA: phosphatase PAP2 family protein [Terracidiphilus sp.]|nr:phosphatase PAP2 family protein [Terracidiphilus sp.]
MTSAFEINPTLCFTLLGSFVIYLYTRPRPAAVVATVVLAAVLRVAGFRIMGGMGSYYGARWISWGAVLGIATLIVLVAQFFGAPRTSRQSLRRTFFAAAVFPLCGLLIGYTIPVTAWLRPRTWDAWLLVFDGSLGFQPSFALGRLLLHRPDAWGVTTILYYALPFGTSVLFGAYRVRAGKTVAMLPLLLSLMIVGFAQYGVFPAVGPIYAFRPAYPANPPPTAKIAIQPMTVPDAPRNCMPSLHMAAVLVIWWNSWIWPRWGRLVAFLFLLATIFSTLALGEHYFADLVVAVPFTLIFQAGWTSAVKFGDSARQAALWTGLGLTAAWLILLRYCLFFFLISPAIPWILIFLTAGGCATLLGHLSSRAREADAR